MRFGTMMTFLMALPATNCCTFSLAFAVGIRPCTGSILVLVAMLMFGWLVYREADGKPAA